MAAIATPDDTEYLVLRDALLHDAGRDQRIHHWISSQYDFALSEVDIDTNNSKCMAPSRADSPLLPFDDAYASANTSRSGSWDGHGECPSYDPLFFTPKTEEGRELTEEEARFDDVERERALKFLIEEMHGGRVFPGPAREKALPALPTPTPYSTPSRSRTHSATAVAYTPSRRASRMPSIGSALSARLASLPTQEEEPPLPELPSPCGTPTPRHNLTIDIITSAPHSTTTSPTRLTFGHTRSRGTTLSFSPPLSPTGGPPAFSSPNWGTSPPGTPALSYSSPPVSPNATRFSRSTLRTDSIESALSLGVPSNFARSTRRSASVESALNLLTTTAQDDDEYEYGRQIAASFSSYAPVTVEEAHPEHQTLAAGPASQSRWSLGSSLLQDDEDTAPAPAAEKEPQPTTRRRLKSLISMLSPVPQVDESPKIKPKSSLASLGYHRRSQQGLPPRSVSPPPPTPSLARASSSFALSSSTFTLPSIAQSPASPTLPRQSFSAQQMSRTSSFPFAQPLPQAEAPTPPLTPMPTFPLPASPPKKEKTLLETLRLKRPKTPKASKAPKSPPKEQEKDAGPKRILVLQAPIAARPALLAWCQAFGEVTHFTPLPAHAHSHCSPSHSEEDVGQGGEEVHVEFASARVAETVCRVRGEVKVAGWTVGMGWF